MTESVPYLGSKISLISKAEIRYEGILYTIDAQDSIIALAKVQSFGTEDRPAETAVPARTDIYEYIIFRGTDIKKIEVCDTPKQQLSGLHNDPAIVGLQVQHSAPPVASSFPGTSYNHQPLGPIGSGGTYYSNYGQQLGQQSLQPSSGFSIGAGQPSELGSGLGGSSVGPIGSVVDQQSPGASRSLPTPIGAPPQSGSHSQQQQDVLTGSRSSTPGLSRKSPVADAGVQVSPPPHRQQLQKQQPSQQQHLQQHQQQQQQPAEKRKSQPSNQKTQYLPERQRESSGGVQGNQSRRQQGSGYFQQGQNQYYSQGPRHNQGYQGYYPSQQQQQQYHGQFRGGGMGRSRPTRRPSQPRGRGVFNQGNRQRQDQQLFEKEFDFEQANVEFEELRTQLAKTKISENGDGKEEEKKDEKREDSGHETATTGDESEDSASSCYDKTKSFFDSISCEALERSKGKSQRSDWRQERKINVQTFGVATARRGYYPRGRGGYYNRGGYYRNYNQGYYRGNPNSNYRGGNRGGAGGNYNQANSNRNSNMNGATGGSGSVPGNSYASAVRSSVAAK